MTNEEKPNGNEQLALKIAEELSEGREFECDSLDIYKGAMKMAQLKEEQLGWHDAKKEQPPMDEEVIVLTNILNGKELDTPRMICFGHIVNKEYCVDYDGWNIPGVEYWMYWNDPTK